MSTSFKPPDKKAIRRKYDEKYPFYKGLIDEVVYILSKGIKKSKIRISNIESRIKLFDSFYDKAVKKEITDDPFESIEDVAGVRIICLYRSDLEKVEALIRDKFDVIRAETLRTRERRPFGYMSDHYVIRIPKDFKGERYDTIKSLKCEIQVRTVSMHAWATVSHHLDYKQEVDIPSTLRDDFNALSGVFRIADSLFEQFRSAREIALGNLIQDAKRDEFNLDEELNLDTLKAYLSWRFPDKQRGDSLGSELLSDIREAQIHSFRDLDKAVSAYLQIILEWLKKNAPKHKPTATFLVKLILIEAKWPNSNH